jgi:cytochrome b6
MGFLYDWWEERLEIQCIIINLNLGWFIKSIHRWSGAVMVLFLVLHITRVYLTGALMKPRELIWITGIMVASRTVGFGVSGYSLAWDQVAFWG